MTEGEIVQRAADLGRSLPEDVRAALVELHDLIGWDCAAHSEGQYCCFDLLLDHCSDST